MTIQNIDSNSINSCYWLSEKTVKEKTRKNVLQTIDIPATISISDEGYTKYRNSLQNDNWEQALKERERIIPSMDGFGEHYKALCDVESSFLTNIKNENGTYNIEQVAQCMMQAYATVCNEVKKGYSDGTREIWVIQDGEMHKLTEEEDLQLLDQAYELDMKFFDAFVRGLENKEWVQKNGYNHGGGVSSALTKDFHKAVMESMKKAQEEFLEQYSYEDNTEDNTDKAGGIIASILRKNPEIWKRLAELSKYITPMS